jgi:soluble lytic murein transglycosylase-like protein
VIFYQQEKLARLRSTAESIFYTMKNVEIQIAQLEDLVRSTADESQKAELREKREQIKKMAEEYDRFLMELDVYGELPIEQRAIFRVARLFGECELNTPKGFTEEVLDYIQKWRTTDRLRQSLHRAQRNGYAPVIAKAMTENDLPPHFFFLALQESDFKPRAVGPKTRFGYAKGIWQFVPATAQRYGLSVGPLYQKEVYDPRDERHDFEKATRAAVRYLRDINNTEAQASGLLVMASYNWGENKVRRIIREMPENPRERNFWRLLAHGDIPRETYDYVFYIFSAAVICENPHLFGFDFECPEL